VAAVSKWTGGCWVKLDSGHGAGLTHRPATWGACDVCCPKAAVRDRQVVAAPCLPSAVSIHVEPNAPLSNQTLLGAQTPVLWRTEF